MADRHALKIFRRGGRLTERGQSLVEAMFMLILILSLVSVFGQILFFELDVFNQGNAGRYNFFHQAHQNQMSQEPTDFHIQFQGRNVSKSVPFKVLFQPSSTGIGSLHFGPRYLSGKKGSKTWSVISGACTALDIAMVGVLAADHFQSTAGKVESAIGAISGPLNSAMSF